MKGTWPRWAPPSQNYTKNLDSEDVEDVEESDTEDLVGDGNRTARQQLQGPTLSKVSSRSVAVDQYVWMACCTVQLLGKF